MTDINKSQKNNMLTLKENKRFISFAVKENTPEANWLNNQKNKSDSLRMVINMCIRLFGNKDIIQTIETTIFDSLLNEYGSNNKDKSIDFKEVHDLDHDLFWKFFKMYFK